MPATNEWNVKALQESGIDWFGEPLAVTGKVDARTEWWAGISSLPFQRQQIVRTALGYYQRRVKEDAGRPNRGKYVDLFTAPGKLGPGVPWCIAFTSFVLHVDCGMADWPYHMSAYKVIEWAKSEKRITDSPLPGDMFAFTYPDSPTHEGHGGFVLAHNADWIVDCDGNVGDAVQVGRRASRGLTFIRTVDGAAGPTMPDIGQFKMLDSTRSLTR
jgi:hypothetical protein